MGEVTRRRRYAEFTTLAAGVATGGRPASEVAAEIGWSQSTIDDAYRRSNT
jgi:hypothetical protein